MSDTTNVRMGWLRFMYVYTIVGAGCFGLGLLIMPATLTSAFGWPSQDPVILSVVGSVYLAFGIISVLGLRSPLKFVPLLLAQLCYKVIWLLAVVLPLVCMGQLPAHAPMLIVVFATYIIGDLIAIPFSYVFGKHTAR